MVIFAMYTRITNSISTTQHPDVRLNQLQRLTGKLSQTYLVEPQIASIGPSELLTLSREGLIPETIRLEISEGRQRRQKIHWKIKSWVPKINVESKEKDMRMQPLANRSSTANRSSRYVDIRTTHREKVGSIKELIIGYLMLQLLVHLSELTASHSWIVRSLFMRSDIVRECIRLGLSSIIIGF